MDPRIDLGALTGDDKEPELLLSNAGALVSDDVVRELSRYAGTPGIGEIRVVMHTDCQLHGFDDAAFLAAIESETGRLPDWAPGGYRSLEEELRGGVARLRGEPLLAGVALRGFRLDIESGKLEEVNCASRPIPPTKA